jgi:hypothetical protein
VCDLRVRVWIRGVGVNAMPSGPIHEAEGRMSSTIPSCNYAHYVTSDPDVRALSFTRVSSVTAFGQ